ncbi:fimbrial protein [Salmonella enterica]|nr:fimbrial protein [Salmonella enterica]EGZ4032511.1 fimbrial protein [Salmonella enterica subsp. enterica serovar Javiana]ELS7235305.1 fimbrial protein [Salmonella enterica]EMA2939230.1 fimbrial protein [Salmonella enterica]
MTLNKAVLLALTSSLVLLAAGHSPVHAASTATATVTIKAKFEVPPCTLTVPPTVFLGSILPGTQNYRPFTIDIECPVPVSAVIYGQQMGSAMVSGSRTRMAMTAPAGSGTPAAFWLSTEGKEIDLTGNGALDATLGFCAGTTDKRSCTLTPSTLVEADTPRGQTMATVRFSVMYP